jgi:hypothetical protein
MVAWPNIKGTNMDNHYADKQSILASFIAAFNIVAARFKSFADRPANSRPGYYLAQHPRVIVASLTFKA